MAVQRIEIATGGSVTDEASRGCGCGCCATSSSAEPAPSAAAPVGGTRQYAVVGMTCGHCVGAVTRNLTELAGVDAVEVELAAGGTSIVTVTSSTQVADEAVTAAIQEAGYTVVAA